jgi:hypothetical protein
VVSLNRGISLCSLLNLSPNPSPTQNGASGSSFPLSNAKIFDELKIEDLAFGQGERLFVPTRKYPSD